jgi:hypothetical protein
MNPLARDSKTNYKSEDFSDEVDEYGGNQSNHRMSIVKRYNTNRIIIQQPGFKADPPPIEVKAFNSSSG